MKAIFAEMNTTFSAVLYQPESWLIITTASVIFIIAKITFIFKLSIINEPTGENNNPLY